MQSDHEHRVVYGAFTPDVTPRPATIGAPNCEIAAMMAIMTYSVVIEITVFEF